MDWQRNRFPACLQQSDRRVAPWRGSKYGKSPFSEAYETRKRVVSRRRIASAFGLFTSLCLRNRDSRGSLGLVGRGLLREASPHQNLNGVVVTLAAGVLPQRPWDRAQGNDRRPGFRPCRRIVNREFVLDRFRVYAREVFGNFQGRGIGVPIGILGTEIGGLHDERVALPMAAPIPMPLVHVCRGMGLPVQRNNAQLESVLGLNHHVSRTLHDHQATVVPTRDYGRSTMQGHASHADTQILGNIGVHHPLPIPLFGHEVSLRSLAPCLARRSQWRNFAIRGIYHQRRSMVRSYPVLPRAKPVRFEVVIGGSGVVLCVAAASSAVERTPHTCIEQVLRFLVRQKLSVSVFGGAFHGRKA